jgi:hypothetical protein
MKVRILIGEMPKVHVQNKLTNGLGAELEHILVDVPCLVGSLQLVENREGAVNWN